MPELTDPDPVQRVLSYHVRTKHQPGGYARSIGYLDWANQPNPFRRYPGAQLVALLEAPDEDGPAFDGLEAPSRIPCPPLGLATVAQLLYDSLALSAWKQHGASRWSLRCNPSSGNLHPTEGYLLLPQLEGLGEQAALYHYAPFEHALERRRMFDAETWAALLAQANGAECLLGLSSIHWREAWKYGERAYRYCQHDVGHAITAISYAAAALGRSVHLLEAADDAVALLLGIEGQRGPEAEHPDVLLAVGRDLPPAQAGARSFELAAEIAGRLREAELFGVANTLSEAHHDWPVIDEIARACAHQHPSTSEASHAPAEGPPPSLPRALRAHTLFRQRRSAVEMDGRTSLPRAAFYRMLLRLAPVRMPLSTFAWRAAIHPVFFVHRVDELEPGLYALIRDAGAETELRGMFAPEFDWARPDGCPEALAFYRLARGDVRRIAKLASCDQDIAADGAFAVSMLGELAARLEQHGPSFYRRLHWEAGALGQVLYLEAEAAGVSATGIGCYFDDVVHELLGLDLGEQLVQAIYHFTVGGAVDDPRLQTLPAYFHRQEAGPRL